MPDIVALVTALILDRPTCMLCLTEKSGRTAEQASAALGVIERVMKVHREANGRCHACGVVGLVVYSDRPAS